MHYWRYKTLPLTSSALTSGKHGPGFGRMNHFLSNMVVMSSLGELFVWYWHMLTFRWIAHSNTVLIGITCWIHSTWSAKGWPLLVQPPKTSWNITVYIFTGRFQPWTLDSNNPKHPEISQSTFSPGDFSHGRNQQYRNKRLLELMLKIKLWEYCVNIFKSESWFNINMFSC